MLSFEIMVILDWTSPLKIMVRYGGKGGVSRWKRNKKQLWRKKRGEKGRIKYVDIDLDLDLFYFVKVSKEASWLTTSLRD